MPLFNEGGVLQGTNLTVHVADGRRYAQAAKERYDVIVADLFHPAQDGAGFLYTREHFAAIRERLAEGGLFCQWLPLHQIDLATLRIISATFETVFPKSERWMLRFNIDTPVIGLIGGKNFGGYETGIVEKRMAEEPRLAAHLREVGLADSVRLFGCYMGPAITMGGRGVPLNTDAFPILIFRAPAITFERSDEPAKRLLEVVDFWPGQEDLPWTESGSNGLAPRIDQFIQARNVYLRGLVQESRGEAAAALAGFIESAKISPDFTAGYAQALTLAAALAQSKPESAKTILEALIAAQPDRPVARELLERLQK